MRVSLLTWASSGLTTIMVVLQSGGLGLVGAAPVGRLAFGYDPVMPVWGAVGTKFSSFHAPGTGFSTVRLPKTEETLGFTHQDRHPLPVVQLQRRDTGTAAVPNTLGVAQIDIAGLAVANADGTDTTAAGAASEETSWERILIRKVAEIWKKAASAGSGLGGKFRTAWNWLISRIWNKVGKDPETAGGGIDTANKDMELKALVKLQEEVGDRHAPSVARVPGTYSEGGAGTPSSPLIERPNVRILGGAGEKKIVTDGVAQGPNLAALSASIEVVAEPAPATVATEGIVNSGLDPAVWPNGIKYTDEEYKKLNEKWNSHPNTVYGLGHSSTIQNPRPDIPNGAIDPEVDNVDVRGPQDPHYDNKFMYTYDLARPSTPNGWKPSGMHAPNGKPRPDGIVRPDLPPENDPDNMSFWDRMKFKFLARGHDEHLPMPEGIETESWIDYLKRRWFWASTGDIRYYWCSNKYLAGHNNNDVVQELPGICGPKSLYDPLKGTTAQLSWDMYEKFTDKREREKLRDREERWLGNWAEKKGVPFGQLEGAEEARGEQKNRYAQWPVVPYVPDTVPNSPSNSVPGTVRGSPFGPGNPPATD